MKIALAKNIRALRRERGLTQERLAELLGVTVGAAEKVGARVGAWEGATVSTRAGVSDGWACGGGGVSAGDASVAPDTTITIYTSSVLIKSMFSSPLQGIMADHS